MASELKIEIDMPGLNEVCARIAEARYAFRLFAFPVTVMGRCIGKMRGLIAKAGGFGVWLIWSEREIEFGAISPRSYA